MANGLAQTMPVSVQFPSGDPGLFVLQPSTVIAELGGEQGGMGEVKVDPGKFFRIIESRDQIVREVTQEEAVAFLATKGIGADSPILAFAQGKNESLYIAHLPEAQGGAADVLVYPSISSGFIGAQLPKRKKNWFEKLGPFLPLATIGAGFGIGALFGTGAAAGAGAGSVAVGTGAEVGALAPVTAAPGVSLAGGGFLLEGPTTFGTIAGGAGGAVVAAEAPVAASGIWGTLAAAGSGIAAIGSNLFKEAADVATSVFKAEISSGLEKEVGGFFGGNTSPGTIMIPGGESQGFFSGLLAKGTTLPIILIILTLLGAFILTKKKRGTA